MFLLAYNQFDFTGIFNKINLYQKRRPPGGRAAQKAVVTILLFKLSLQNVGKLLYIVAGVILFPKGAVDAGNRFSASIERHPGNAVDPFR